MEKVSFDELLAKAEQRRRDRHAVKLIEVPGLGALEFSRPGESATLGYYERIAEASSGGDALAVGADMIYDCCPALQDTELHAALGIEDPADVVPALFEICERDKLGQKLLVWCGLMPDLAENTLKN